MKTKILLMFCVLLLTAAPAMAVNIVNFKIATPNGPPELTGMFTIEFSIQQPLISSMFLIGNSSFTQLDEIGNEVGEINFQNVDGDQLKIATNDFNAWQPAGGIVGIVYTTSTSSARFTTSYVPKTLAAPVPEPTTMMLLSTGLVGLIGYRWRQGRREGQQVG